jgi:hypothetical protein
LGLKQNTHFPSVKENDLHFNQVKSDKTVKLWGPKSLATVTFPGRKGWQWNPGQVVPHWEMPRHSDQVDPPTHAFPVAPV